MAVSSGRVDPSGDDRSTENVTPLASRGIQMVLAMEVSPSRRTAKGQRGNSSTRPADELGESTMGRTSHPRRTPEAGHRCQSVARIEVHAVSAPRSGSAMEDLFGQPPGLHCLYRLSYGSDNFVQTALCARRIEPSTASTGSLGGHCEPDGFLDGSADARGLSVGRRTKVCHPRSPRDVRRGFSPPAPAIGNEACADSTQITLAERPRRKGDRLHP